MLFKKKSFKELLAGKAARLNSKGKARIVFADTADPVLAAASLIKKKGLAEPLILGSEQALLKSFKKLGLGNLGQGSVVDFKAGANAQNYELLAKHYFEIKKTSKSPVSEKEAKEALERPHFYAALMVEQGLADCFVSGFDASTKPLRAAVEVFGLAPDVTKVSGLMIMASRNNNNAYFFADCAFIPSPSIDELAQVAELCAKTAAAVGLEPKVAFLSFSTNGAAHHPSLDKVRGALEAFQKYNPKIVCDGELQADCAIDPAVSKAKCPDSPLGGDANVLIFPDLNSGNISYKLLEKLGGYDAIGPIFLGLNKPANDLSKPITAEEVYLIAAVTLIQVEACKSYGLNNPSGLKKTSKQALKRYHPLELIPANVKKIIEEAKAKEARKEREKPRQADD